MDFLTARRAVGNPKFDTKLIVSNQSARQIISELLYTDTLYNDQYKKLAPNFDSESNIDVGKKIFDFLKKNIKYKIEPFKKQSTKSPASLFYTKTGDCKNYSNFAAGIFKQLGIPYKYRFASYSFTDPTPTHVYIVFEDNNGNEKVFDAVLNSYLSEASYIYKEDKKPVMALYRMSGVNPAVRYSAIGTTDVIGKGKLKKFLKKAGAGIKKAAGKLKQGAVTVAAAPVRTAFLGIIALNAFKSRDKLAAAIKKNPDKVHKFWKNFGGDFTKLKKAAKVSGIDPENQAIGVALATLAATAAPIVLAFRSLLKEVGVSDLEGAENVGANISKVQGGGGDVTDADSGETLPAPSAGGGKPNAGGGGNNTMLYLGLGAAALYFMSNKN